MTKKKEQIYVRHLSVHELIREVLETKSGTLLDFIQRLSRIKNASQLFFVDRCPEEFQHDYYLEEYREETDAEYKERVDDLKDMLGYYEDKISNCNQEIDSLKKQLKNI